MNSLTYRSPKDEARFNHILARIRFRRAGFALRILTKLAIGIPLSFLGPAIVATIAHSMFRRAEVVNAPSWLMLFNVTCLIVIPVLYLIEWHYHGDFFTAQARANGITIAESYTFIGSYVSWRYDDGPALAAFYLDILLVGPKEVFSAVADLRQRIDLTEGELGRAAQLVLQLASADGGLPIADLRHTGDSPLSFRRVLQYLRFHDWIDISKHNDRAWLLSTARKWIRLNALASDF